MGYQIRNEKKNKRTRLADVAPLPAPYVIFLEPSGVCNFKCSFCPCNNNTQNISRRHQLMDMSLFEKIVRDIMQFPRNIRVVELYAFGEPMLNRYVPEMIKKLKESGKVDEVRMATNGSLLNTESSHRLIDAGLDYLKISLEGMDVETYKNMCDVDIDWNQFVDTIQSFFIASRGSKTKLGIKAISNTLKTDDEKQRFLDVFSPISDYTFIETVYDQWAEFVEMRYVGGVEVKDAFTQKTAGYDICSFPLTHMLVCANGDIGLCCLDWKHGTTYANVHEISLYDAWNSDALKEIRIKHLDHRRNEVPFCCSCTQRGYDNVDDDSDLLLSKIKMRTGA